MQRVPPTPLWPIYRLLQQILAKENLILSTFDDFQTALNAVRDDIASVAAFIESLKNQPQPVTQEQLDQAVSDLNAIDAGFDALTVPGA